jgi:hypothetical protein
MSIIPLDRAREHVKADSDDDTLLQVYLDAAERSAGMYLNRTLYADTDTLSTARNLVPQQSYTLQQNYAEADIAAKEAYDQALTDAESLPEPERTTAILAAQTRFAQQTIANADTYNRGIVALDNTLYGIVMTDDIKAAVLLHTGHLYRNRESVTTGVNTPASEVPMTTKSLLDPHVRIRGL